MTRWRPRGAIGVAVALAAIIGAVGSPWQLPRFGQLFDDKTVVVRADTSSLSEMLGQVRVVPTVQRQPGYERGCGKDKRTGLSQACVFGPAWNNPDNRTGCDTRNLILAAQMSDTEFKPGTRNCKVVAGWTIDPYSGERITVKQTDIDHIVPLSAAWNAGASQWPQQRRVAFANDPDNLLAVSSRENSSKSDSTISQWLPPIDQCAYIARYLSVVIKYELPISEADRSVASRTCPAPHA